MKETELAYAAGIVDGEGYIGVKKSKAYECQGRSTPGYHALVSVKMVDRAALALLHRLFGGSYYAAKVNLSSPRRPLFAWQVSDAGAERCLSTLLPFMLIKKPQAKNVLALRRRPAPVDRHAHPQPLGVREELKLVGAHQRLSCREVWVAASTVGNRASPWRRPGDVGLGVLGDAHSGAPSVRVACLSKNCSFRASHAPTLS